MKIKSTLKTFALIAASLVVLAIISGFLLIRHVFSPPFDDRPFDRGVWIKNYDNQHPDNPRVEMISDLENNYLRKGVTRKQVVELLGKPDRRDEKHVISYLVGMQGFVSDPGQLELEFDEKMGLIRFYLVER